MKNYIIIFFCVIQSCNSAAQNDSLCEKYCIASIELVFEYQLYGDSSKLDTALYYTELALPICSLKYVPNLLGRKLGIFSLMRNYDAGIKFIQTLKNPFIDDIPYYNSVLLKRFYAMKSLYEGDTATYKKYVYSILDEITSFIIEHQTTLDSLCKNDLLTIWENPLCFAQIQYYYYKSFLVSSDVLSNEFDLLKQKEYDSEYLDFIKLSLKEEGDFLFYQFY
jgi:hypothetical protein